MKPKTLKASHVKAVMLKENAYGKPEPTDTVQAFSKQDWDKMKQLKGLMWEFIEFIPMPYPEDELLPRKTGGSELIAYKSFVNENPGVDVIIAIVLAADEQVNDKFIDTLATTLKTTPDKVKEQIITKEKDPDKMEVKLDQIGLAPDTMIIPKNDFDAALDRKGKTKYDEGRFAEREMTVKELKKKHEITDDKVKDIDSFLANYADKVKAEGGISVDAQVATLKKEKADLQALAETKDKEIQTLKSQHNNEKDATRIQGEIGQAVNAIEIDIPDEKLPMQRKALSKALLDEYDFKLEDGMTIAYHKGTDKKVIDALLKPIPVSDLVKEFAPKMVNVKTPTGRGDKGNPGGTLTGDLAKIKDKADFEAYLKSQNITDLYSEKAQSILMEIKKGNPNFKLA